MVCSHVFPTALRKTPQRQKSEPHSKTTNPTSAITVQSGYFILLPYISFVPKNIGKTDLKIFLLLESDRKSVV